MTSCHYRGSFWLPWSCAVRGPVDPVDVPAVRLPGLSPCCPVQEGPPLLPVLQVSPSQLFPNWSSPNQEVAGVEQLQDLQADVRGRTEPGVGEDGRDDRTAVQVRGKRLLRARLSTQQTPAWDPLQVTKKTPNNNNKKRQQQQPIPRFRPTECQYTQNGCDQVFAYKVTANIDWISILDLDLVIFRTCLGTTRCAPTPTIPTQTCCRRCQTGRSHRNEQNQGKQRREKTLQQMKKCPQWTDLAKPTSSQNQEKNWALCWNLKSSVRFLLEWAAPKKGDNKSSPHLAPDAPPRYCYTSCQNRRDIWSWHQLWMSTTSKYITIKINRHKLYCSSLGGRLFWSTFKKGALRSNFYIHSLCSSKRP